MEMKLVNQRINMWNHYLLYPNGIDLDRQLALICREFELLELTCQNKRLANDETI